MNKLKDFTYLGQSDTSYRDDVRQRNDSPRLSSPGKFAMGWGGPTSYSHNVARQKFRIRFHGQRTSVNTDQISIGGRQCFVFAR